ncbi:MAG: DUF4886 domain-containing protein [Firmicutes bacterium]|nr:DUF4886 domain-containing protein [Bacillota bacterium]
MNILAIGNSFSEDATYYLHSVLDAAGVESYVVNLYIGGCSLERHWQNIEKQAADYQFQENGIKTERLISIQEALLLRDWDVIVTQQASHDSGWAETYEPFLGLLVEYLRKEAPRAKIFMQKTWAYEPDSPHPNYMRYHRDQAEMMLRLSSCYREAAARYGLPLIPCADLIQKLRALPVFRYPDGPLRICRDGFHMHYLYGRYALACIWARAIAGIRVSGLALPPASAFLPDVPADPAIISTIQQTADSLLC